MSLACFYESPNRAQKKGYTITKTATVGAANATKLRNYFQNMEKFRSSFNGLVISLLGSFISTTGKSMGYSTVTGGATMVAKSYLSNIGYQFDRIATRGCPFSKCRLVYKYHKQDSQNGAYFLSDVKFL